LKRFRQLTPPTDPAQTPGFLLEMQRAIVEAANQPVIELDYSAAAPTRPQSGIYFADGTNWNPGSGRGAYRYDPDDNDYHFLG
jgi:hypothetical protein